MCLVIVLELKSAGMTSILDNSEPHDSQPVPMFQCRERVAFYEVKWKVRMWRSELLMCMSRFQLSLNRLEFASSDCHAPTVNVGFPQPKPPYFLNPVFPSLKPHHKWFTISFYSPVSPVNRWVNMVERHINLSPWNAFTDFSQLFSKHFHDVVYRLSLARAEYKFFFYSWQFRKSIWHLKIQFKGEKVTFTQPRLGSEHLFWM